MIGLSVIKVCLSDVCQMCWLMILDRFLFKICTVCTKIWEKCRTCMPPWDLGVVQLLILSSRIRKILESSGSGHACVVLLCSVKLCVILVCILCTLLINNG